MGSICALRSCERVLEKHRDKLINDLKAAYDSPLITGWDIGISDSCYELTPILTLQDGTEIELAHIHLDVLEDMFPDVDIGY